MADRQHLPISFVHIDGWPATKSKRSYWITESGWVILYLLSQQLIILAFALDKTWCYAQLVDSALLHHIHSFLSCCIVTSVFRIMCCLRSFIWGSGCSMTRNMKGICSWLTINWFRPSLLSRKYNCALLSLSFSASSSVLILQFRSKVYAWQGTTWKHDFKCFSHEYIYI